MIWNWLLIEFDNTKSGQSGQMAEPENFRLDELMKLTHETEVVLIVMLAAS